LYLYKDVVDVYFCVYDVYLRNRGVDVGVDVGVHVGGIFLKFSPTFGVKYALISTNSAANNVM
jgi:hypothetical protein